MVIDYRPGLGKAVLDGLSLLQVLVGICDCIKVLVYYGIDYRPVLGKPGLDG
jgi:hypothetical protein